MKQPIASVALACTLAWPAIAQPKVDDHSAHHPVATASTADMSEGEIRKIDKVTKKITIKHGELRNLDMPAMTMVFKVMDGAKLEKLKAGDKIRFVVEKTPSGLVVTEIRPAP